MIRQPRLVVGSSVLEYQTALGDSHRVAVNLRSPQFKASTTGVGAVVCCEMLRFDEEFI